MTMYKIFSSITFSAAIVATFTVLSFDTANAAGAQNCKSGFIWDSTKNKCVRESSY